jgi:two-component system cell cycle sensor histidine kinase/response regulator CckA
VCSRPGEGSTFEVWLPLAVGQQPTAAPSTRPPVSGSETVLLVDDEAMVLRLTRQLLEELGYHVLSAQRAEDALAIAESGARFDALLTDVRLPGMNGPELVRRVVALRGAVPVVFMSGFADEALPGPEPTVTWFLPKPFSYADLAATIRAALDAHTARPA